ncbi:hypothetical protein C2E23DRAFT_939863 [Lenzites betulinus]|nr:hypothetical protein C2E23DRAFT_939863 [Lenzites betulinus]
MPVETSTEVFEGTLVYVLRLFSQLRLAGLGSPKRSRPSSPSDAESISRQRLSNAPELGLQPDASACATGNAVAQDDRVGEYNPHDIEDMYGNIPPPRVIPPAPLPHLPSALVPMPQSRIVERPLGLFDDPSDLDATQQDMERFEDVDNEHVDPDPDANIPVAPLASPPPEPDEHIQGPNAEDRAPIPGLSEVDHPLLARTSNLPDLSALTIAPEIAFNNAHPLWWVRIILLLAAFLHTHHHVTFRATDITLFTLRTIFVALGMLNKKDTMPVTLKTTIIRLNLVDKFHILIECEGCRRLYRPDITNYSARCSFCETPLFTRPSRTLFMRIIGREPPTPIPKCIVPIRLISAAIAYLVAQPDMEAELEAWLLRKPPPMGEYRSIFDGHVWQTIEGPDGKPFFGLDYDRSELRVGLIFHGDWFSAATSAFSPSYSTGALSFSIANFPPALRYCVYNILVAAFTDGPKEPDAEELQYWISIIVDDLLLLYHLGILAPTPSHKNDKSHHEAPCTGGEVKAEDMYSDACLQGGCPSGKNRMST